MSRRFVRALPNLTDRPGRVLVCEDSEELRALLVGRLAKQPGLEVVGDVAGSREALEAVVRLQPDALLLDLVLEGTEPEEVLLAVGALESRPLVIVFSGLAPSSLGPAARAVIDLHLDKTTPLLDVAELVAKAIASHRKGEQR